MQPTCTSHGCHEYSTVGVRGADPARMCRLCLWIGEAVRWSGEVSPTTGEGRRLLPDPHMGLCVNGVLGGKLDCCLCGMGMVGTPGLVGLTLDKPDMRVASGRSPGSSGSGHGR